MKVVHRRPAREWGQLSSSPTQWKLRFVLTIGVLGLLAIATPDAGWAGRNQPDESLDLAAKLAFPAAVSACWHEDPSVLRLLDSLVRQMTLEERVGQLFVTHVWGDGVDTTDPSDVAQNRREFGVDTPAQVIQRYHLGGIVYFNRTRNIHSPRQLARLSNGIQRAAAAERVAVPMLISTDQEQGLVVRVGPPATQFPGNMALGAGRSPLDAFKAATITGRELKAMGVNQDLAPVADVNVNPANPVIGIRSFGSDPRLVSEMTAAQVLGYQLGGGVSATAKHFPGHGDTDVDSHFGFPVITHSRSQ